jgi:hypothetical protein
MKYNGVGDIEEFGMVGLSKQSTTHWVHVRQKHGTLPLIPDLSRWLWQEGPGRHGPGKDF